MVTALAPLAAMGSVAGGQVIERDGGWWTTDADGEWSFSLERPASTIDLEAATTVGGLMDAANADTPNANSNPLFRNRLPNGECPDGYKKNMLGFCTRERPLRDVIGDTPYEVIETIQNPTDMFARIGTAALGAVLIFGGIILAGGMRAVSVNLAQASGVKYKVGG